MIILTLLLAIPVIGAIILLCLPKENEELIKWSALGIALVCFVLSLPLYLAYNNAPVSEAGYRFVEQYQWIPQLNISYHIGIDGLSLFLVIMTTFLTVIAIASSWTAITEELKAYYALLLFLQTAMLGVFMALDIFLFYLF